MKGQKLCVTPSKNKPDINLEKLAEVGNISLEEVKDFIAGKTIPDMPSVDAMAEFLGVQLPEINVVDFVPEVAICRRRW